jgi:hypothetical protein
MPIATGSESKRKRSGLIKPNEQVMPPSPVEMIKTTDENFKPTSVDLKWTPRTHLLTHIEGSSWSVDYYSQVITTDSDLSGQQVSAGAPYQSYTLVRSMDIKVTSPLSANQDDATKVMKVSGSAMLYPFLIPNEGDMFIADIGEGRQGLFRVTGSIKKSIFAESCYEIAYDLDTDAADKISDLRTKVIKTVYYHKDFLSYGQNPLLLKDEAEVLLGLEAQYQILMRYYMKRFFSHEYKTLAVPSQLYPVYDPFLVEYMAQTFSIDDAPEMYEMMQLNMDDDPVFKCDSIWTVLANRDVFHLNTCFRNMGLVSIQQFGSNPLLMGVRYSGFARVVYPTDPTVFGDNLQRAHFKTPSEDKLETTPVSTTVPDPRYAMVRAMNLRHLPGDLAGVIPPVNQDTGYVLTQAFYNQTLPMSTLEGMVVQYAKKEKLDTSMLLDVSKVHHAWGVLEQFYYIPILLTFIKSTIRGY